jgi:hypothetical protein
MHVINRFAGKEGALHVLVARLFGRSRARPAGAMRKEANLQLSAAMGASFVSKRG